MANDVTSITKSLDRIADALEGGSSGGGGSEPTGMKVTFTHNPQTVTWSSDTTFADIKTAIENNINVYAVTNEGQGFDVWNLSYYNFDNNGNKLVGFIRYVYDVQSSDYLGFKAVSLAIFENNTVQVNSLEKNLALYSG